MVNKDAVFSFLDDLRDSGKINMFGAGVYVQELYQIERNKANDLVKEWMATYSDRHPIQSK